MVTTTKGPEQVKNGSRTRYNGTGRAGGHWPQDILEAYARDTGPYTVQNAWIVLEEEPIELYNGWLVWQELTNPKERQFAGNILEILSLAARLAGLGQAYPDQLECLMTNGDTVKPDVCVISDERFEKQVKEVDPEGQHTVLYGGPELVVEIRSRSNRRAQERRKRRSYFESGTLVVWDVDPDKHKIWVYEAENPAKGQEFSEEDEISCERLLPGWRRKVSDLFTQGLSAEQIVGKAAEQWRADERVKTLLEMLLRQARKRFGEAELPQDLEARLATYNAEQLTDLVDNLAVSASLEDWLARFPT